MPARSVLTALAFAVIYYQHPYNPRTLASPRERISINDDWRFTKATSGIADGPLPADRIKQWLPTGNAFIKMKAADKPPQEGFGERISYAQASFDDSGWRRFGSAA